MKTSLNISLLIGVVLLFQCSESSTSGGHCTIANTKVWDLTVDETTDENGYALDGEDSYMYKPDTPEQLTIEDSCDSENDAVIDATETIWVRHETDTLTFQRHDGDWEWEDWVAATDSGTLTEPENLGQCEDHWSGFQYTIDYDAPSITRTDVWYLPTSCACDQNIRAGNRVCPESKWND